MGTVEELTIWNEGIEHLEQSDYKKALKSFNSLSTPSSKITFNIGCCRLTLNCVIEATESFERTIQKDEHLAVAYFQLGVANYKQNRYEKAKDNFITCHQKLRDKRLIDYNQLGMRYKLYACEPLYNAAVCFTKLRNNHSAREYMAKAESLTAEPRHSVIKDSCSKLSSSQITFPLLELPVQCVFKPAKSKIMNMQKKNYLGKAKVVSSTTDTETGFDGPRKMSLLTVDDTNLPKSSSSPALSSMAADVDNNNKGNTENKGIFKKIKRALSPSPIPFISSSQGNISSSKHNSDENIHNKTGTLGLGTLLKRHQQPVTPPPSVKDVGSYVATHNDRDSKSSTDVLAGVTVYKSLSADNVSKKELPPAPNKPPPPPPQRMIPQRGDRIVPPPIAAPDIDVYDDDPDYAKPGSPVMSSRTSGVPAVNIKPPSPPPLRPLRQPMLAERVKREVSPPKEVAPPPPPSVESRGRDRTPKSKQNAPQANGIVMKPAPPVKNNMGLPPKPTRVQTDIESARNNLRSVQKTAEPSHDIPTKPAVNIKPKPQIGMKPTPATYGQVSKNPSESTVKLQWIGKTFELTIKKGSSLNELLVAASAKLGVSVCEFDMMYIPPGSREKSRIANELQLVKVWKTMQDNKLTLWCCER